MTVTHSAPEEALLRRLCLEELAAQGLQLPEGEQELVVSLCVSAYREDLENAQRTSAVA
ncbi:MAG: hypothetical protein JWO60_2074 [Frankiales bacterium]|nr:hypothetical protein [Frankiales bacterium]